MIKQVQDIIDRLKACKSTSIWDIIDAIGWGSQTTDYKVINAALRVVFSDTAINSIGDDVRALAKNVYARAEKANSDNFFGFSDDGWMDATNHIVGLGKEVYDRFMEDPVAVRTEMEKTGGEYWNEENFAYSFHT